MGWQVTAESTQRTELVRVFDVKVNLTTDPTSKPFQTAQLTMLVPLLTPADDDVYDVQLIEIHRRANELAVNLLRPFLNNRAGVSTPELPVCVMGVPT